MARKKKEIIKEEEQKEIKIPEKKDSISYKGNVKVSILKNGKLVNTKRFHNAGRYSLFKFLAECLRGNYKFAEPTRPKYISIFSIADSDYAAFKAGTKKIENLFGATNRQSIGALTFKGTPYLEVDQDNQQASITYEFSIPFINIKDMSGVNSMAIYGNENWDYKYDNPSAYWFCPEEDGKLTKLIGDNESFDANYSVLVEWKMIFKN